MTNSDKYQHLRIKILSEGYSYVLMYDTADLGSTVAELTKKKADFLLFSFANEKSLICESKFASFESQKIQHGWTCLKIEGDMPFGTVQGLISRISSDLFKVDVGVCVISSFLSDFFFIKTENLPKSESILRESGWNVIR